MGRRGPPPQPTSLRILRGNPGHRPLNESEPQPPADAIEPPSYLQGVSLEKWHDVVKKLEDMSLMTNADVDTIARYCVMYERYQKYLDQVRRGLDVLVMREESGRVRYMQITPAATMLSKLDEQMLRVEREFGFTPASRSEIQTSPKVPNDPLAAFVARRSS
jgi:P27 family predicted phage terminase small subunit